LRRRRPLAAGFSTGPATIRRSCTCAWWTSAARGP
jgi:hypothetical protein